MKENSQWSLFKKRNFLPLFLTQFLGAFNDNIFKNALVILLAFNSAILPNGMTDAIAVNISAGLFIFPFFIFSALAGQLADKYEKSKMIRILKVWEIMIVCVGIYGLYISNVYWMWTALFGLGMQSAFFGPLKYSILPEHLETNELIGGNALIESGTFLAILLGTILGGILIQLNQGWLMVGITSFIVALLGYLTSRHVPKAPSNEPNLIIGFNIFKQTWATVAMAKKNRTIFLSILGISWFWFFGATLLAQFPSLVKNGLGANESVVTLLLAVFSIGIGLGSLLCEKMSGHKIETGLIPLGAIGLSLFCFDLFLSLGNYQPLVQATLSEFIASPGSYRILIDLLGLSMFGGIFIVPLYALIQARSESNVRSRIIAANNILNAVFMVFSAIFAVALFSLGFTLNHLILSLAVLNTIVAIYIFTVVPEFISRFLIWAKIKKISEQ